MSMIFFYHSVALASLSSIASAGEQTNISREASTLSTLRLKIKPPIPLGNGSTYSILPGSGTIPATFTGTGISASASTTSAYKNETVSTICPSGNSACMSTCQSAASVCHKDLRAWSTARDVFQSSVASEKNSGVMPIYLSYITRTVPAETSYSYSTSWIMNRWTTSLPGWAADSAGLTTITTSGTTRTAYKSEWVAQTFTTLTPVAEGGTGVPVSTRFGYESTITITETSYYSYTVPKPSCAPTSWTQCAYKQDCNKCTISGGTVQLLYFPVTRTYSTETVYANYTRTTITAIQLHNVSATTATTPAPTGLETAIYKNFTLTSPSVYISFETAYAQNQCGSQIGSRYPGAILPLPLSDLSSVYGGYGTLYTSDPLAVNNDPFASATPYLAAGQFNLEDMNWPPPMSAYTNQLKFKLGGEVFNIMTKPYNPHLAVPEQIRGLDAAWRSCELDWEGLYDPPTALTPAGSAATPTLPTAVVMTSEAAQPVRTGDGGAKETRTLKSTSEGSATTTLKTTLKSGAVVQVQQPTETSLFVVVPGEPADTTSTVNIGSLLGVVPSAAASEHAEATTSEVSFIYDPAASEETTSLGAGSSSMDIGAIIISALGGGVKPTQEAQTGGADGGGHAELTVTASAIAHAPSQGQSKPATITSAPGWTLVNPSEVVVIFGSSQYTAIQSVAGEIVVDKTATITAGGAALTLPGGKNGGTLSMQSDGRLVMGNTVQGTGEGTLLVDPGQTHELQSGSRTEEALTTNGVRTGAAVAGDTAIVTFGTLTWSAVKVSQGVQLGSGIVLATDVPFTTDGRFSASAISKASAYAVAPVVTLSTSSSSQDGCPYWRTCVTGTTGTSQTDAATATVTGGGVRSQAGVSIWSAMSISLSIIIILYV